MTDKNKAPTISEWLGLRTPRDYSKARPLGHAIGFVLKLVFLAFVILFGMALAAAFFLVSGTIKGEEAPTSLGLGALLVALLGAPFLIWRTVVAQNTLDTARKDTALKEEAIFNDKINIAAKDLAARHQVTRVLGTGKEKRVLTEWEDDIVTRAAAIDRLEGLAIDAINRNDFPPAQRIARMLSIYVQELSRTFPPKPAPEYLFRTQIREWAGSLRKVPRQDVERAVQSLGRINPKDQEKRKEFDPRNIDLRRCNLQGFSMYGLNFCGAQFNKAHMEGAILSGSQIQEAILRMAKLTGAVVNGAQMQSANLFGAQLQGADLRNVQMEGAILSKAQMQGSMLNWANMQRSLLLRVHLQGANLYGAQLQGAELKRAHVHGANLSRMSMSPETKIDRSNFSGAAIDKIDEATLLKLRPNWKEIIAFLENVPGDAPVHWVKLQNNRISHADRSNQWRGFATSFNPKIMIAADHAKVPPVTIAPDYRDQDPD